MGEIQSLAKCCAEKYGASGGPRLLTPPATPSSSRPLSRSIPNVPSFAEWNRGGESRPRYLLSICMHHLWVSGTRPVRFGAAGTTVLSSPMQPRQVQHAVLCGVEACCWDLAVLRICRCVVMPSTRSFSLKHDLLWALQAMRRARWHPAQGPALSRRAFRCRCCLKSRTAAPHR